MKFGFVLYGGPCVSEENFDGNILSNRGVAVEDWVRLGIYERTEHVFT